DELAEFINSPSWNRPAIYYDDDEDYTIPIIPDLVTEEPVNSLSMGDEHRDTILTTKSDEVIKFNVENLVPIPSESKGIPDKMCHVPFCNNPTTLEASKDHSEIVVDSNDDSTSSDDNSLYGEDIDYVDASPPDSELVSLEVVEIVILEVGGIDDDILLTIKDDILREKLLNVNLLIANIEVLKDNPTPSSDFVTKSSSTSLNLFLEETNTFDNSLPETKTFHFNLEEISSGSPITCFDLSLPDYEAFYLDDDHIEEISSGSTTTHADFSQYDSEPDPGELTSIVDSGIRENVLSMTNVNLPFEDDQSPLLAYVVWIFLAFLTYGYIRNHKKTVKNGQAQTRERKSEQKPEAKARKSQIYSTPCALIRKTLEEVFQDFQNTFESSDDDTNFVNENQEPFVVNQDPGKNSSQSPPHIDHCCCGYGGSLDDIFCQRCTCKSCRKGAHYGYNCPPQVLIISKPEPCNNQTVNEFPQTLPSVHPTSCSGDENSFTYDSKPNFVDDSPNVFDPPPQPPMYSCEFYGNDARYGHYCTPQVLFIYPEPCYNQDFNFPQDFHDFQQQYLCCEDCGGPHETFQCQPMNYYKPNPCYDSNYSGFDQTQPP
ncbi:hypothetical protein Tco_0511398, partial [Tanacetum coccineum]